MLAADPDAGLEMFGNMRPPLPPSAALPILTTYAPHLAGELTVDLGWLRAGRHARAAAPRGSAPCCTTRVSSPPSTAPFI